MDYPSGDWKYCSCGASYYVYEDRLDPGECGCQRKLRYEEEERKERKLKRLERENKKLRAQLEVKGARRGKKS